MRLIVSKSIEAKLNDPTPGVSLREVQEAIANRAGKLLIDDRAEHKTNPPTYWFVAETNKGRMLKVMMVLDGNDAYLKSAYGATPTVIQIFERKAGVNL